MAGVINGPDLGLPPSNRKPSVDSEADDDNGGGVSLHEFASEDRNGDAAPTTQPGLNSDKTGNGTAMNGTNHTTTASSYDVENGIRHGVAPIAGAEVCGNTANASSVDQALVNGREKLLDPTSKAWEPLRVVNPIGHVQTTMNPSAVPVLAPEAGTGMKPVVKLPSVMPQQQHVAANPTVNGLHHAQGGAVGGTHNTTQSQLGMAMNGNPSVAMGPSHHHFGSLQTLSVVQPQHAAPGVNGYYHSGNNQVTPAYGLCTPKPAAQGNGFPNSFNFPPPGQLTQSFSMNSMASIDSTSGTSGTTRTKASLESYHAHPNGGNVQYATVVAPAALGQNGAVDYQYNQRHPAMPAMPAIPPYRAGPSYGPMNGNPISIHHQLPPAGIQQPAQNAMYANPLMAAPTQAMPVGPMPVVPYQPAPAPTMLNNGPGHIAPYQGQSQALTVCQPVPDHVKLQRSALLNELTAGPTGRPTIEKALDPKYFPFIQSFERSTPANNYGVVKLKNIPFSTRRVEIIAFLGRNSKILNDNDEGVHIIMERVTSKTNDAYVEFMTLHDAMKAVDKHHQQNQKGRLSRLQDRPIEVELSSQAALMKDLFPLARGVFWEGAVPLLTASNPKEPWDRFKGFVSEEEMTMLVKHVEIPQRSPFSRECPQRPYECMISTLKKLPWYKPDMISIVQRQSVYNACLDLIRLLQQAVETRRYEDKLTPQLLKRLVTAAMLCPSFSVLEKDNIAYQANLDDLKMREFYQPRFANSWLHQYSIAPKPGMPLDVIEWYVALIREESTRMVHMMPLNDRARIQMTSAATDGYWGYFWFMANYPVGPAFDNLTLAAVSMLEFEAIQRVLQSALGSG